MDLKKLLLKKQYPLRLRQRLWWRFMPGEVVSVKWPSGMIVVGMNDPRWIDCGARWTEVFSADPCDFYRPYLQKHVGRKGWDWDWDVIGDDLSNNRLSIKIRRSKSRYASFIAMKWS